MDRKHPTILPIRKNSTLIAFGDCFLDEQSNWRIQCYFKAPNNIVATVSLAVELLPALALRRRYSPGKITVDKDEMRRFTLPSILTWKKMRMAEAPTAVYKAYYIDQCKNQWIYNINIEGTNVWLPTLELARMLFLKTAENTRYAFYETNLMGMAVLDTDDEQATIRLSKQYPRRLLDTKMHQEYLAWLLLNKKVSESFCSIFEKKNAQTYMSINGPQWTFDFTPPELQDVIANVYGNSFDDHFFVNEIISFAKVPTDSRYRSVVIEHPDDIRYNWKEGGDKLPSDKPGQQKNDVKINPDVDDSTPPSADSKQRVLSLPSGKLYFSALLEPKRHFAEVDVEERQKGKKSGKEGEKETSNTGVTEGDNKSKNRKVDFQMLKEPDAISGDFFRHIRTALQIIKDKKHWKINERTGELTDENDRFFCRVAGIRRRYFCGEIVLLPDDILTIIEIDLSDKHGLTTLLIRLSPENEASVEIILDTLVEHAGHWSKKLIDDIADTVAYVTHPKNLEAKESDVDYESWASRIVREI